MWVGILENENVRYKSICVSGKVNNGLLTLIYMGYFDNLFYMGGGKKAPQSNSGI